MTTQFKENFVSVSRTYRRSPQWLWSAMGDPRKLSGVVPMLADFTVKGDFVQGSSIEEVHTIGGWPQHYDGRVLSCEEPVFWSMSSVPRERFPFGLPHTVSYRINPSDQGGEVSIQCSYSLQGLLKLFVPEILVRMAMKRTLEKLLNHIGKVAVNTA